MTITDTPCGRCAVAGVDFTGSRNQARKQRAILPSDNHDQNECIRHLRDVIAQLAEHGAVDRLFDGHQIYPEDEAAYAARRGHPETWGTVTSAPFWDPALFAQPQAQIVDGPEVPS